MTGILSDITANMPTSRGVHNAMKHFLPWWSVVFTSVLFLYIWSKLLSQRRSQGTLQSEQTICESLISLPTKEKHPPGQTLRRVKRLTKWCRGWPNPTDSCGSAQGNPHGHWCMRVLPSQGWHGRSLKSSRGENPRRRCKVFLSMQTDVRFSCDQLTTKRLSSLIL